ncbi:hypothetical protein OUZ56_033451 [Daphnia magna]|uniref:Uncharacterized protein n=1 Tax=Daphnia magna TaxID=35525 RepID=A0ABR0BAR3_9CRUS|nr:hypothetical protein OUZ56_033451 [Daphnia magna]
MNTKVKAHDITKCKIIVTYSAALTGRIVGGKGLRFVFMLEVALAPFFQCFSVEYTVTVMN